MSTADGVERDVMQYDVVVVGAGPAGLACAIRLKQLKPAISVCVLEKASGVGAHSLSGAVLEPGPLEQLLPEWHREYPGMKVPATEDDFRIFTRRGSFKPVPDWLVRRRSLMSRARSRVCASATWVGVATASPVRISHLESRSTHHSRCWPKARAARSPSS